MKGSLIICLLLCSCISQAQLRLSVLAGPALSAKDKNQDTAFFSDKGSSQVLKLGYHKGRLGLVLNGSFVQQKPGNVIADKRTAKILADTAPQGTPDIRYIFTGGNITTTVMSFTPQLCFPLGKIKLNVYAGGGMAFIKATPAAIVSQFINNTVPPRDVYTNSLNKESSPVFQSGLTLQIPLLKKLLLDINGDYLSYKLSVINKEKRNGFQPTVIESQRKLFNVRGGLTYKF